MRIALDTNVLAYAEGVGDSKRCELARQLIAALPGDRVLLPAQTLGELFRVLVGKASRSPAAARDALLGWADAFDVADATWSAFQSALDLATDHDLQIWEALILAVAAENACRLLLSEDLDQGFVWHGVTVANPFASPTHPAIRSLVE